MSNSKTSEKSWFTRAEMARLFDCSGQSFDANIRRHVPDDCIKRDGRRVLFHGRGVLDAWRDATSAGAASAQGRHSDADDQDLRLKRIKADREQLRLDRERGEYVHIESMRETLNRVTQVLRRAGDALQKKHGAAAFRIFNDALDEAEQAIAREFDDGDDDHR